MGKAGNRLVAGYFLNLFLVFLSQLPIQPGQSGRDGTQNVGFAIAERNKLHELFQRNILLPLQRLRLIHFIGVNSNGIHDHKAVFG